MPDKYFLLVKNKPHHGNGKYAFIPEHGVKANNNNLVLDSRNHLPVSSQTPFGTYFQVSFYVEDILPFLLRSFAIFLD
jgi:hypothetical protein